MNKKTSDDFSSKSIKLSESYESRSESIPGKSTENSEIVENSLDTSASKQQSPKKSIFFVPEELQDELNELTYNEILLMNKISSSISAVTSPGSEFQKRKLSESDEQNVSLTASLKTKTLTIVRKHTQLVQFVLSLIISCIIGGLMRLRKEKYSDIQIFLIKFPGLLYYRVFSNFLLILSFASVISTLARINLKIGIEIFWRFLFYSFLIKALTTSLSIFIIFIMAPGKGIRIAKRPAENITTTDVLVLFTDLGRNSIPENLISMNFERFSTKVSYSGPSLLKLDNITRENLLNDPKNWTYNLIKADFPNYTGIIVLSIMIGLALQYIRTTDKLFVSLMFGVERVMFTITYWFSWLEIVGQISLLVTFIVECGTDDIPNQGELFDYFINLIIIAILVTFCVLPVLFYFVTLANPWPFYKNLFPIWLAAFTTRSSFITLTTTFNYFEKQIKLGRLPSRLLVPIAVIINLDGVGMIYSSISTFIAQALNRPLSLWDVIAIWLTSLAESVRLDPIPSSLLPPAEPLKLLMHSVNLEEYLGVLYIIRKNMDIFDRVATVINANNDILIILMVHFVMMHSAENAGRKSQSAFLREQEEKRVFELQNAIRMKKMAQKGKDNSPTKIDKLELVSVSTSSEF